jgi:hypothetical protein
MKYDNRTPMADTSSLREVEIETGALLRAQDQKRGRFLKGPIPLVQITTAASLPGQALALFLVIHHQMALTGKPVVTLPKTLLTDFGIGKDAKSRGLRQLENSGLIRVQRSKGRSARITIPTLPNRHAVTKYP